MESKSSSQASSLTEDEVIALFEAEYLSIPRREAYKRLKMPAPLFGDYMGGRRRVAGCKKILADLGLERVVVERFERVNNNNGKDKSKSP